MDLKNILAYQAVDAKLYELESDLAQDANKQKCNELNQTAKASQTKSSQLEEQAGALLRELEDLKKNMEMTTKKGEQLLSANVEEMTKQECEEKLALKEKVAQNLALLDKRLTKLAENINTILAEFNRTIKLYNSAKEEYQKYRTAYDKKAAELQPKIDKIRQELEEMKKSVDPKIMQTYLARRADKIFPVLVKLDGTNCGRCRMELSASAISKLKQDKIMTCEHCRRIIYFE